MAIKTRDRDRSRAAKSDEFEAFVEQGGTVPSDAPSPAKKPAQSKKAPRRPAPAGDEEQEAWVARKASAKQTEAYPFRFNTSQQRLLERAKAVEGRDYSKILAELVWPVLEERYGKDVPLPE